MKTGRCAVDLDNVVVNIIEAARKHILRLHDAAEDELVLTGIYGSPLAWRTPREPLVFGHAFWDGDVLLASAQPLPGAVEALHLLHNQGLLAGYISRRSPSTHGITRTWLELHGCPSRPLHHVGSTIPDRHHALCKSDVCKAIGAEILIEDSETEAARVLAEGIIPVLIDHHTGREARREFLSFHPGLHLANDILEAVQYLTNTRKAA